MRGIAKKTGGLVKAYRHFRVYFPSAYWRSLQTYTLSRSPADLPGGVADLYLAGTDSDANLTTEPSVTWNSNYFSNADISSWRAAVSAEVLYNDTGLRPLDQAQPYIGFTLKTSIVPKVFGICVDRPLYGFVLVGSLDGVTWERILAVPPYQLVIDYPWVQAGNKWYTYTLDGTSNIDSGNNPRRFWGIVLGAYSIGDTSFYNTWSGANIKEVAFKSSGVSLHTSGSAYKKASYLPSSINHNWWDGDTGTGDSVPFGYQLSYDFVNPVNPDSVSITIYVGITVGYEPTTIDVVYSDDGWLWSIAKVIDTPPGTWAASTTTEATFTI